MKILYLAHSQIPSSSANSIQVMHMCQAFEHEHRVTLLARNAPGGSLCVSDIFDYYGIARPFRIVFPQRWRLKAISSLAGYMLVLKMLVLEKPEICFGRHLKSLALAVRMGVPVIYEAHEVPRSRTEKVLIRQIYASRSFAGMVFISSMLQNHYQEIFHDLPQEKVMVAHDGIDLDRVSRVEPYAGSALAGSPDGFKAGYVGGLKPEKGIGLILCIAGMMPQTEFHLVGGSHKELQFWRSQAAGMDNIFFYGQVNPGDAVRYQKSFDVLLAPYQQASWGSKNGCLAAVRDETRVIGNSPLKFFEYMACEKPVLTSDIPIAREIFTHQGDAFLLNPDNPREWVSCISALQNEPGLASGLSANARKKALKYTWEQRADNIIRHLCG